jgi:hypothetical protein
LLSSGLAPSISFSISFSASVVSSRSFSKAAMTFLEFSVGFSLDSKPAIVVFSIFIFSSITKMVLTSTFMTTS